MRVLFIGDIVGSPGVALVRRAVPVLRRAENIDLVVEELLVLPSSRVLGRTLGDSGIREAGANVLAIRKRSGQLRINPPENQVLEGDDLLVAIGTRQQMSAAERLL